ncbi:MAG: signal recognition particle-docking protein FtsY [Clostridia bacterium]|nr:signal recognition particle-docking protein FtsY [Clostridia bacterium]MBQ4586197.1 signal recognition particle-docking protein FtsY [Clostridia bacterium]MBQ6883770.1 signal recognition particle-docking protein FtsY [Clostridia bacterium]MBR2933038.1 signal recognition particle-docking protein FtsY [Clostridia bacterium]
MGLFSKIKESLVKTKNTLASKIAQIFTKERIGEDFYDDLLDILISSDISVTVAEEIIESLHQKMRKEKVDSRDVVLENLRLAIKETLDQAEPLELEYPAVIMVIGVNGVGKTTTIGKLANRFSKQGKSVTIAAADTFRAAATEQLDVWADRAGVRIIKQGEGSDPSAVVFDAASSARSKKTDVLIIDTAGRLHVKANLMEELKKMSRVVAKEYPEANFYKFIVLDSTTGQNALSQVQLFNEAVGIDGIVLTKLDGTAKGGFVLNLTGELNVPVVYVGVGEKIDDIEDFDSESFAEGLV